MSRGHLSVFLVSILVTVQITTSSSVRNIHYASRRIARQASCQRLEYTCANRECIPSYNVCDGTKDCSDGSDETRNACRASGIKCPSLAFECSYGACIDRELRCNGQADCADGSDEDNCPNNTTNTQGSCGPLKFKCSNGQCINRYDTCDGIINCDDGSDETRRLCSELMCPSSSFQCDYGACLEPSVKCDDKPDCPDNSDERNCPTNTTLRPNPTPSTEGGCRLPEPPKFGAYTSSTQCNRNDPRPACRNTPGTLVEKAWVLQYTCNSGYSPNKENDLSVCLNGVWSNKVDCIKLCPPLKSVSVDVKCTYNGREVPCDRPMRPDTTAVAKCKQHYREEVPESLYCLLNGEWSANLFRCTPVCGVPATSTPLILYGNKTRQGEFPWLAALYYPKGYNSEEWEQKCGGTLISPHIVVTAAHCLVQQATNIPLQPHELKIGLGKYYRDFYKNEDASVIVDVKEVIIRKEYKGSSSNYALDIGLLDLVESVQINAFVMPACVDWSNSFKPAANAVGIVAGWGTTETGNSSDVILSTQLTFITFEDCFRMITAKYKALLTYDKFCAKGGSSGGQVEKGDSGGGLTFLNENGQHLLIGIVSTKIHNETEIRLFTDLTKSEHSTWLENERRRLVKAHRD